MPYFDKRIWLKFIWTGGEIDIGPFAIIKERNREIMMHKVAAAKD
jgi:hypothetical protein